jgi:hypothetical protein
MNGAQKFNGVVRPSAPGEVSEGWPTMRDLHRFAPNRWREHFISSANTKYSNKYKTNV